MELLWSEKRATARHIREQLYPEGKNQHGTVQRLLQRLEEKGYVRREADLPVHLFSATVSREDYATGQLESLADRLTGGSLAPIMTRLVEQKRISQSEIDRLRRILDEPDRPGDP
jgi:BlaI family transcriptional regulator, penicillinase repressor